MTSAHRASIALLLSSASLQCVAITGEDVIEEKKALAPVICELLRLERQMAAEVELGRIPLPERMERQVNQNIKDFKSQIQSLFKSNMAALLRIEDLERQLPADERAKVSAYVRSMPRRICD